MVSSAAQPAARLTADGIELPEECSEVVDVLFDEQRVLTLTPPRYTPVDGLRSVSWPRRLLPYLTGETVVTIREHVSGVVWLETLHSFDGRAGRTAVLDGEDHPLAVDKWGFLVRTFDSTDSRLADDLLTDLAALLQLMETLGVPAFIAYGTLLGAVRDGAFIGHDNDADIAYVSHFEHPADIASENFRLERGLLDGGWRVRRSTAGFLQVWRDDSAAEQRKIDIFAGYFLGTTFSVERWVRAPMSRDSILPLGTVQLEGRPFPAPAHPETLLAATYGEGWRVPDPAFTFQPPRGTTLRSAGWFGEYWRDQGAWSLHAAAAPSSDTTGFAAWVGRQLPQKSTVVDLGCGSGVAAVSLAEAGHQVVALDYSADALALARERAARAGVELSLNWVSFEDLRGTLTTTARVVLAASTQLEACSRNLLNALSPHARSHLWRACQVLLTGGGRIFLEYVDTVDEAAGTHVPQPRVGQSPPLDELRAEISAHGGTVAEVGHCRVDGLHVTRLVAEWTARPGPSEPSTV